MITINLLGPDEQRQAQYLSALAKYRVTAAQFATDLVEYGQADKSAVDAAREELARREPTPAERARPIREVAESTGITTRTIRRWAAEGQVWAEQRYGKLWYVDPDDVQRMSEMEPRRGWPLGKPRK